MSYVEDFVEINKSVGKTRSKVLSVIFSYLQQYDYENLQIYYSQVNVKRMLLPIEQDFLDGLIDMYYGPSSEDDPPKKKESH